MRFQGGGGGPPRHGVARVLSKLGICSRTQGAVLVHEGRVTLDGETVHDPEFPCPPDARGLAIDGNAVVRRDHVYLMLNKPRGLVTSASDEKGRDTVYSCFDGAALPWIAPVGRLDRASEGLLLFTSDPAWSARVADPDGGVVKRYHVQVDRVPDDALVAALARGVKADGEMLRAHAVRILRAGAKHGWLEIDLDEGRNRQIRRMLQAQQVGVLRLVRIGIGGLPLGELARGAWRMLTPAEVAALADGS